MKNLKANRIIKEKSIPGRGIRCTMNKSERTQVHLRETRKISMARVWAVNLA